MLDELDLAIVNALQINPRAPWSLVGQALEVDAVTVSRRWSRMRDAGEAWVTGFLTDGFTESAGAVLEITCRPGQAVEVAERLAKDPQAYAVKLTSGGRDLLVLATAADLSALSRYLLERPGQLSGVLETRSYLMIGEVYPSQRWRLRSLPPAARSLLARSAAGPGPRGPAGADGPLKDVDRRIATALAHDGRMRLQALAQAAETSLATARRRMNSLLDSGRLTLRCDLARSLSGWPVTACFWGQLPVGDLADLTSGTLDLAGLPEVRVAFVTAGPHNLYIEAWLRSMSDALRFEARLGQKFPRLAMSERTIVLRTVKHTGRMLDETGRCTGTVPPAITATGRCPSSA